MNLQMQYHVSNSSTPLSSPLSSQLCDRELGRKCLGAFLYILPISKYITLANANG